MTDEFRPRNSWAAPNRAERGIAPPHSYKQESEDF
jgi:hypothetical protein